MVTHVSPAQHRCTNPCALSVSELNAICVLRVRVRMLLDLRAGTSPRKPQANMVSVLVHDTNALVIQSHASAWCLECLPQKGSGLASFSLHQKAHVLLSLQVLTNKMHRGSLLGGHQIEDLSVPLLDRRAQNASHGNPLPHASLLGHHLPDDIGKHKLQRFAKESAQVQIDTQGWVLQGIFTCIHIGPGMASFFKIF